MTITLLHSTPDPRLLVVWAARHNSSERTGDLGYTLHGLLVAIFGEQRPSSFRHTDEGEFYAYTKLTPDEIALAVSLAPPAATAALGFTAHASNPGYMARAMPQSWPIGRELGFEARVRPVVRDKVTGKEKDVFLRAVHSANGAVLDKDAIYGQWLQDQVHGREVLGLQPWQGGAEISSVRVLQRRLLDVTRRTKAVVGNADEHPDEITGKSEGATSLALAPTVAHFQIRRKAVAVGGPDVLITGRLLIRNPEAFSALVARGVGRHRGFGYGMLMLRP